MMRATTIVSALLLAASAAGAQNVAAGKTVTQVGTTGSPVPTGWGDPPPAAASTITDGTKAPTGQHWQGPGGSDVRTVWWTNPGTYFEIALGALFDVSGFKLNADNNDKYVVSWWNGGSWVEAFNTIGLPRDATWGMANWNVTLGSTVTTDRLRVHAEGPDFLYSVSELEAIGTASVPEPATVVLLGTGLAGIALVARRRRQSR